MILQEGCRFKSSFGLHGPNPPIKLGMNSDWKMVGNPEKVARKEVMGVCISAVGHQGEAANE